MLDPSHWHTYSDSNLLKPSIHHSHSHVEHHRKRSDSEKRVPRYFSVQHLGALIPEKYSPFHCAKGIVQGWGVGKGWQYWKTEILSGLIVCFAQVPETMAFSLMANLDPSVGLHATWIVGLFATALGNRTGLISGVTGAVAAVVSTYIEKKCEGHGHDAHCEYIGAEALFLSVLVASVLMFLFALLRLASLIQLVPTPVMIGFVNGLAIVIGLAQLHPFQMGPGHTWVTGKTAVFMAILCLLAMITMEFFTRVPVVGKLIPSSLVAVASSVAFEFLIVRLAFGSETLTVDDVAPLTRDKAFPLPFWIDSRYDMATATTKAKELLGSAEGRTTVITQGVTLFIVATMENLMTTEVVADLQKTPYDGDQQMFGTAVGNFFAGLLGTMGGDAMIGLSVMNCRNGSTGKEAGLVTSICVFLILTGGYEILNYIPMAALSGIMFVVVFHTFRWYSIPMVIGTFLPPFLRRGIFDQRIRRWDALVILAVTLVTVFTNIMISIGLGIFISALVFAWDSQRRMSVDCSTIEGTKYYEVSGPVFFGSKVKFESMFDYDNDPDHIVIVLRRSGLADYSALESINAVKREYQKRKKTVRVKGLSSECVRMLSRAGRILKHVDLDMVEMDVPEIRPFASLAYGLPGIEVSRRLTQAPLTNLLPPPHYERDEEGLPVFRRHIVPPSNIGSTTQEKPAEGGGGGELRFPTPMTPRRLSDIQVPPVPVTEPVLMSPFHSPMMVQRQPSFPPPPALTISTRGESDELQDGSKESRDKKDSTRTHDDKR